MIIGQLPTGGFSVDQVLVNLSCKIGNDICSEELKPVCCEGNTILNMCVAKHEKCYSSAACAEDACNIP